MSNLGVEVKVAKYGHGPEYWNDRCRVGKYWWFFWCCVLLASKNEHIWSQIASLGVRPGMEVLRKPRSAATNLEGFGFSFSQ